MNRTMSYSEIREEIVGVLNKRNTGRFNEIDIDSRGDVFHAGLGDNGTVILTSEQLDDLAALVATARGLANPE